MQLERLSLKQPSALMCVKSWQHQHQHQHQQSLLSSPAVTAATSQAAAASQVTASSPPAASHVATPVTSGEAEKCIDIDDFDGLIGSDLVQNKVPFYFQCLARVEPKSRGEAETLLAIRLGEMLGGLDAPTPEVAETFTVIYQGVFGPNSVAFNNSARQDLRQAYEAAVKKIWQPA